MQAAVIRQRLGSRLTRQNAPVIAHVVVLAVGLLVFAIVATRSWFFYDDWYFLKATPGILWAPHVGHWSTVPVIVFAGIQRLFGMDYYLPFALPAILVHLGAVHLTWRIMLRATVRPWVATAFSVLLVFLGAGAEALDWAVQIGFVGAVTTMLGCILILDTPRLTRRRAVIAAALVLLALMTSGVAFPFILVAGILAWIRHGLVKAIAVFIMPMIAYGIWYLLEGHTATPDGRAGTIGQALAVPQFAVTMLTDGLGRMFPLLVLGGLVFVALSVWWAFTIRSAGLRTQGVNPLLPYLLFLAAPVFALLTGFSRIGNGLTTATSSRYVYVVVIAITPLMAFALDRAARRASVAPVAAIILVIAAWNMGGTAIALIERIHRVDSTRAELAQTAALIRADSNCLAPADRPSAQWAPDVTVSDVTTWLANGWYHPAPVTVDTSGCKQ